MILQWSNVFKNGMHNLFADHKKSEAQKVSKLDPCTASFSKSYNLIPMSYPFS